MDTVQSWNQGRTAGKKSGAFDLGDKERPRKVGPNNILDVLLEMESVAMENLQLGEREDDDATYAFIRTSSTSGRKMQIISVIARVKPDDKS